MYDIQMFEKVESSAKAVTIMLWVNIGLAIVSLFASFLAGQLEAGSAAMGAVGVLMIGEFLLFVTTGVVFLVWMNRAHKSAQGVGDVFFEHTSASAVWWWFVPIASLWKPMNVMREIHSATRPISDENGDKLISTWWGLWIAMNFTSGCQGYGGEGGGELGPMFVVFGVIAVALEFAAAYYAIRVVETITEQQEEAWTGEKTAEVFS